MRKLFRTCYSCFCAFLSLSIITATDARGQTYVGVELVLAVDTSISVSETEYRLQMAGISNALRSPDILDLIADHPGGVAMTLVHWSIGSLNKQAVEWRHLETAASVFDFATAVEQSPRRSAGRGTSISDALVFSTRLLNTNTFVGEVRKIDISGDSRHNSGPSPHSARDDAVLLGITINGLVIEDGDRNLGRYFQNRVIGGDGSFVMSIQRNGDFADAMRRKLARELRLVASLDVKDAPE